MTVDQLETALDDALVKLSQNQKDTTNVLISENAPLSKIIDSIYESVFECLESFKDEIIEYEANKG